MRKFISDNNVKMVECSLFNWRIQPIYHDEDEPFVFCIDIGGLIDMHTACYDPDKKILSISDYDYDFTTSLRFHCETIESAEEIVSAFIKGNDFDISNTIFHK